MAFESESDELSVSDVVHDKKLAKVFKHAKFNSMQSIIARQVIGTSDNMVIAAPTGSGKTVIHELAILRCLIEQKNTKPKILFIAPNKALCQQRCAEWQKTFGQILDLRVIEVTGRFY